MTNHHTCLRIEVRGVVQGVGFRPFVYRLALTHQLKGFVLNDDQGVSIEIEGAADSTRLFLDDLRATPPRAACVTSIETFLIAFQNFVSFEIRKSPVASTSKTVPVAPDLALCQECLNELWDPQNRRYFYPFINCTHCGPRFTLIEDVPYDRSRTTMAGFSMCPPCRSEYENPLDRRFHAQPIACPSCGPSLSLLDPSGHKLDVRPNALIAKCCELLREGKIIALKGLGGFHLCCDATNENAVASLRARKYREMKPFAVMFPHAQAASEFVLFNEAEKALLQSMAAPIVLLKKLRALLLAPSVAPKNQRLGVMLPYTPLHELILKTFNAPLVMTSGNRSDEPIAYSDPMALERLHGIADYFLTHNRPIHTRCDDSVVKIAHGRPIFLRRSRGFSPDVVTLNQPFSTSVFATGADLKNTFCLTRGNQAILSHHIGDLDNFETMLSFEEGFLHFKCLFGAIPQVIAHDLHPGYRTTKWVQENFSDAQWKGRVFGIQHHHAHLASCLAENEHRGAVLGLALDGTGYGLDGTIWGGELLLCDQRDFIRAGHLKTFALPGGDPAIHHPWRIAMALLTQVLPADEILVARERIFPEIALTQYSVILQMLASNLNCATTSSCGRLFDGVSALIGCTREVFYEGQAAIELEQLANNTYENRQKSLEPYLFTLTPNSGQSKIPFELDWRPAIRSIFQDLDARVPLISISYKFHAGLVEGFLKMTQMASRKYGIKTVALSGGCFQNDYLRDNLITKLEDDGFTVLFHKALPTGDGGIALGQAVIADRTYRGEKSCVWQYR
ncbi:carbamoyltransferase HypF [Bdellovibrionota bacterium FG-1]